MPVFIRKKIKTELTKQLAEQAKLAPQLNDIEESLLEKLEQLETEEADFAAQFAD